MGCAARTNVEAARPPQPTEIFKLNTVKYLSIYIIHAVAVLHVIYQIVQGGGLGAVVKTACLESRKSGVRAPLWPSSFKEKICFFPLTCKYSILWGSSVTEKFRILFLEGSVISFTSPSSGGSPCLV